MEPRSPDPGAVPAFRLPTDRVVRALLVAIAALLAAHAAVLVARHGFGHPYVHGIAWRFDLDREGNVPTLFSALVLLGTGVTAAAIARLPRPGGRPDRRWWGVCAAFVYLAFDEGAQLHEIVTGYVRREVFTAHPAAIAVAVAAVALLTLAAVYEGRLFRDLSRETRTRITVAAALYLGSVAGLEIVEWRTWRIGGIDSLAFSILATIEETGEMVAAVLFLRAFLAHLAENADRVVVRLR